MHNLTGKRVKRFARDFGFGGNQSAQFERYVAAAYLHDYLQDDPDQIERVVLGGGRDEGIDVGAVIVNGQIVFEPADIDELIGDQNINTARVVFIQAKTSESYDSKLIAKFLHGVEAVTKYAMNPKSVDLSPQLVDLAHLIEHIAEYGDKFQETRIPCELYYVTTSANDGAAARSELQVVEASRRISDLQVYSDGLNLRTHGHDDLFQKQKERLGPQNISFFFERRQTIPSTEQVSEAYIGLLPAQEVLKLLMDETGEVRPGIFDDNVRLDLGAKNPVNQRIMMTLQSADRKHFPFLNNGLTIIATSLRGIGDRFSISGYQIVNGGQSSHQLIRWAETEEVKSSPELLNDLWVPVKIVASSDSQVRTNVAVATNLQTAIGETDVQASSQIAKDVEEYFSQSGANGLRYERQVRGAAPEFPRTRVVGTSELNRAVAATLFGESSKAIGASKDLEQEGSFVWGPYPLEVYYYAAWVLYRVERLFGRNQNMTTLRAAKYHLAMMVSAMAIPDFVEIFEESNLEKAAERLAKMKSNRFDVHVPALREAIENGIERAAEIAADYFKTPLAEGRSLRKDDVRSRRHEEALLAMSQTADRDRF